MALTNPPAAPAAPGTAPSRSNRATFAGLADAAWAWLFTTFFTWVGNFTTWYGTANTELTALQADVTAKQVSAAAQVGLAAAQVTLATAQATAAASSALTAGAVIWVTGTVYAVGDARYSPLNLQTYRRRTNGGGATDPSLDPANWTLATASAGAGGTAIAGSVTLTAASPAAMTVTPTAQGQYMTMPDATTCVKADNMYAVYNAGDFDYGVRSSTGVQLGWVRSRTGAMIGLSDNSTAAGVWVPYGLVKTAITASYFHPTLANMGTTIRRIALDANRTCFLFGGVDCYAIVYDASTQTWGSPTAVRLSVAAGMFVGVLSAANQVLVISCNATTGMQAVTLSIAANVITVNAAVNKALAFSLVGVGQLIPVSTSFVFSYGTTNNKIIAISVAGTVPTIGAEVSVATLSGAVPLLFASGSIVRTVLLENGATNVKCTPYTVSAGTTLTVGTVATAASTAAGGRAFLNGNGNIVVHYINATHYASIFKLTGTVEAVSSVSLGTVPAISIAASTDLVQVTAGKTAFASITAAGNAWYANLLTDTAGTASAGTEVVIATNGNVTAAVGLGASGNFARFASATAGQIGQTTLDCSGASVTVNSAQSVAYSSAEPLAFPAASDLYSVRSPQLLTAGSSSIAIGGGAVAADPQFVTAAINSVLPLPLTGVVGVVGSAANESFMASPVNPTTTGFTIQRVEIAA
jgi:hypothetical protein